MGRRQLALTALEFYSGIGGMHYALQHALPHAVVLEAFDINQAANTVYQHNFAKAPRQVRCLGVLSASSPAVLTRIAATPLFVLCCFHDKRLPLPVKGGPRVTDCRSAGRICSRRLAHGATLVSVEVPVG